MLERIEKIRELLEKTPGDNFLQHALALEYIKMGREEEAEKLFRSVLENDPGYTGSYYHLGKLLERTNRNTEALLVYERGMEECRKSGDTHAFNELKGAFDELAY